MPDGTSSSSPSVTVSLLPGDRTGSVADTAVANSLGWDHQKTDFPGPVPSSNTHVTRKCGDFFAQIIIYHMLITGKKKKKKHRFCLKSLKTR